MAEIVNLRRVRKAKARSVAETAAAANRMRYGAPKVVRKLAKAQSDHEELALEARRLDDSPGPKS